MKRKNPFAYDSLTHESNFLSQNTRSTQQSSINKFDCSNKDCCNYLYLPNFLAVNQFPEVLQKIPLFLLDPNISVGVSTSKPLMCNLLSGSPSIANNSFGMEIERFPHISAVEHTNISISHMVEQCVKTTFSIKTNINIEIKESKVYLNNNLCEFKAKEDEFYQTTEKIFINNRYSVEFELNFEKDKNANEMKASSISLIFYYNDDFNSKQKENMIDNTSFLIESEIPLIFDFSEESDNDSCSFHLFSETIRIIAPNLIINTPIKSTFCDFLIASNLTINEQIECRRSIIIRSNDLILQSTVKTSELLIISSETTFSNKSSLKTSNLCAIFANNSFECSSTQMKLASNTFIKSRNIYFHSKKTTKPNLEITTTIDNDDNEYEEEEEESNDSPNHCFLQAENINIGPNFNIHAKENFAFECSSLNISNKNTSIEIDGKLYLLFVTNKESKKIGLNEGIIKCYDMFFEVDSDDSSPVSNCVFKTTNAVTVRNAFLLSSGTFKNSGNVAFRSFYISAYSKFKCSKEKSSFKVGDFFVIESRASFVNKGKIYQYSTLLPTILNSGRMIFSYNKEKKTETKQRGRKKSNSFLTKSSDEKINFYSLKSEKFVSNGEIEGDFFSIIANDLISIAGNVKCQEINLEADEISIINFASMNTYKATLRSLSFEIKKGAINASNLLNESDILLKPNEKVTGSSCEVFYQNEMVGDIENIKQFDNLHVTKTDNFRKDPEKKQVKAKRQYKKKKKIITD